LRFGDTTLTPFAEATLDTFAIKLRANPTVKLRIEGYADSTEASADVVSRQRAEAVLEYLVREKGFVRGRFTIEAKGASKPLGLGETPEERLAKDRRVEFSRRN
jgi:OOP family OmpA-OmpF porin